MMNIHMIRALSDNYIWMMEEEAEVLVVDPGEASGVLDYLKEKQLHLKAILLTHNHDDHTGGVAEIVAAFPGTPVYGPKETEPLAEIIVQDGDSFTLLGHNFHVFQTVGHTNGHISYLTGDALFCGDALFSGGCGRVFTKDYAAQYAALQWFKGLDDAVQVYAAHEYTQTNLRFAHSIHSDNEGILKALDEANRLRDQDLPTLPSTIGKEKEINVFLQAGTLEQFIELRTARDHF